MPEKRCDNCNGEKAVCRRCGRTPLECAEEAPRCNGDQPHEFIYCLECAD